jgi:ATP-dependent Clp protease adaptor protein ClpS
MPDNVVYAAGPKKDPGGPAVAEPPVAPTQPTVKVQPVSDVNPRLTPMYKVMIHNDDVTPMDFVVHVLREIFKKNTFDSAQIMLKAHFSGVALVTVLPLEQAELRVEQSHSLARTQKYPLTFSVEPA